jgi:hypothetical protein
LQGAGDHFFCLYRALDAVLVLGWLDPAHARPTFERIGAALTGR